MCKVLKLKDIASEIVLYEPVKYVGITFNGIFLNALRKNMC